MTRTKLRAKHAAIIANLRDKVAVITADRDDLEEQRQIINKMVDAAEARTATARREAFDEALAIVLSCTPASAGNDGWTSCQRAISDAVRAARDRGTP